ncbi:hypothetical protein JRQ81_012615 [Phrynocephalus forsythii]|uniref:Uncharacterized protein n=1 Tax=Phrynocephalus forsythii TaxID=171643 RepID=A0A9Q0Y256_9SAUR|nr:hypothetical protein JRQ81_012615 [Phrynocephalus forsythii]
MDSRPKASQDVGRWERRLPSTVPKEKRASVAESASLRPASPPLSGQSAARLKEREERTPTSPSRWHGRKAAAVPSGQVPSRKEASLFVRIKRSSGSQREQGVSEEAPADSQGPVPSGGLSNGKSSE